MKIVLQNVLKASVEIDGKTFNEIDKGYLLLVSFTNGDNFEKCSRLAQKISKLRVFPDESGKTNCSIFDINGSILSVSQFTIYADVKKGNRPSFTNCLNPDEAIKLFNYFNEELRAYGLTVKTGIFGADMKVSLVNDGPFTLVLDSEELCQK